MEEFDSTIIKASARYRLVTRLRTTAARVYLDPVLLGMGYRDIHWYTCELESYCEVIGPEGQLTLSLPDTKVSRWNSRWVARKMIREARRRKCISDLTDTLFSTPFIRVDEE